MKTALCMALPTSMLLISIIMIAHMAVKAFALINA